MQRRSQPRAPKKARLVFPWLGLCLMALSTGACFSAQGPLAVAADKEESESKQDSAAHAQKADGEAQNQDKSTKPHVARSKEAVDLAVAERGNASSDLDEPSRRPSSISAEDRPQVVKDASTRITEDYRSRLMDLQEQHVALNRKSQELTTASKDLMAKLDEISALEDRLQRELGIGKARQEYRGQRIKSLAALIMTMPPQSGARILSNMSERDAQEIVLGMAQKSERKAAKLLAQMPPNKAAELGQRYLSADKHIKGSDGLVHTPTSKAPKKEATP